MQAAASHAEPAWFGRRFGLLPVPPDARVSEEDFEQVGGYDVAFRHALFGVLADAELQRERRFSAVLPFTHHWFRLCATAEPWLMCRRVRGSDQSAAVAGAAFSRSSVPFADRSGGRVDDSLTRGGGGGASVIRG